MGWVTEWVQMGTVLPGLGPQGTKCQHSDRAAVLPSNGYAPGATTQFPAAAVWPVSCQGLCILGSLIGHKRPNKDHGTRSWVVAETVVDIHGRFQASTSRKCLQQPLGTATPQQVLWQWDSCNLNPAAAHGAWAAKKLLKQPSVSHFPNKNPAPIGLSICSCRGSLLHHAETSSAQGNSRQLPQDNSVAGLINGMLSTTLFALPSSVGCAALAQSFNNSGLCFPATSLPASID